MNEIPAATGPLRAEPADRIDPEQIVLSAMGPAPAGSDESAPSGPRHAFAHESEAELARILDFYAVRWEYEPHTYPILWNLDGGVLESFSPDFYLPDLDMYLELTTLRQRLVRKKNRKLRRLRELYPDIRIKLFYARDFRMLMLKYGKVALVDALSGTSGQVVPPGRRPPVVDVPGLSGSVELGPVTPAPASHGTRDRTMADGTARDVRTSIGTGGSDPSDADPHSADEPGRRGRRPRRSRAPDVRGPSDDEVPTAAQPGPK